MAILESADQLGALILSDIVRAINNATPVVNYELLFRVSAHLDDYREMNDV